MGANPFENKLFSKKQDQLPNQTQHLVFVLTYFLFVSLTVIFLEKNLPEPLTIDSEDIDPERFIAEKARNFLANLTSIGPRVVGSVANEVLAVKYLKAHINDIIKKTHQNHIIMLDVTKHSGEFPLTFLDGMTSVYRNVQNVMVKIGPRRASKHSLLLNCHFDSAIESPGILFCKLCLN